MRKQMLMLGLLLALLVLAGQHAAAEAPNVNAVPSLGLRVNGGIYNQIQGDLSLSKVSGRRAKIVAQNSFSLSLDANSVAGDQGVASINVSPDQVVSIQVFGSRIQNARGFGLRFEYDASQVLYEGFDVGSVLPGSPQVLTQHGTNPTSVTIGIASFGGQATASSGLVGAIRFRTTTGFSGTAIQLVRADLSRGGQSETVTLTARVALEVSTEPSPDFDGDGTVGISDFLLFVNHFGTSRGGAGYDAKYDLDGNGAIGISDFLIFVNSFGSQVPPSGGGSGGGGGFAPADQQAFNSLVVGKRIKAETYFIDFESAGRFLEGFRRHEGRYTYSNMGANTGTLTQNYDAGLFGGRCTTQLTFSSTTTGTLRYTCDNGDIGEEERWQISDLTTPIFAEANADTLVFVFLDTWSAGQTRAYDFQFRQKTPQGSWRDGCVAYPNESGSSVTTYVPVRLFGAESNTTYEMRYRYRNSSSCNTGSPGPWSPIAEGTTSARGQGSGGGGGGGLDPTVESKLYWTDWGTGKIQRSDLDGSNVEDLVSSAGLNGPDGLALDVSGGKMYWTDVGTNKIQRADLDGSNVEDLVTSGLSVPYGLALDVSGGKMYWSNRQTSKIQRADLDGSNVEDLLTLSGLVFPGELALDVSGGKMYWTNPGMDKIQRANLNGSNVEDLVATGLNSPTGLALDVSGGKMYWTDRGTHKIQRANLDGSNIEDLVASGLNTPTGLALDVFGGKMYWTDVDADKVQRANLDGSNVEDLLTRSDGLVDPSGLAVGVISRDTGNGGGGTPPPPPSGDAITGSITECSGTRNNITGLVSITIKGTVQAHRQVSNLRLTGYANGEQVGVDMLNDMSPGQSQDFSISGTISTSGTSLSCSVEWNATVHSKNAQGVVDER